MRILNRSRLFLMIGWVGILLCLFPCSSLAQTSAPPSPEIRALLEKGAAAQQQSKPEDAAGFYKQALETAREHKDRPGEAAALAAQGFLLLRSQPTNAQGLYEQALSIYQELKDESGQAMSLFYLGYIATLLKQPEQGLARYNAAYPLYQKIGAKDKQALTLMMIGGVYRISGQFKKALSYFEQAIPLYQQAGDTRGQVMAIVNAGNSYQILNDPEHALTYFQQAHALLHGTGDDKLEIGILHNIASAYAAQGDYPQALKSYEQALPLDQASGNRVMTIDSLNNLGILCFRVGDYFSSLKYLYQVLPLEKEPTPMSIIAMTRHYLATVYSYIGQLDQALEQEKEALSASEKGDDLSIRAGILGSLGRIYGNLHDAKEEQKYVDQSLALYRQIGDQNGQAYALHFMAINRFELAVDRFYTGKTNLATRIKETAEPIRLEQQARPLFEATHDDWGTANSLLQSGSLLASCDRFAEAIQHYQQALALFRSRGMAGGEVDALAWIGDIEEQQGNSSAAEQFYTQALLRQEILRSNLGGLDEAKSEYHEMRFPLYQRYIGLMLQKQHPVPAFEWTQKAKARTLLDLMAAGNVKTVPLEANEQKQQADLERRGKALSQQWIASVSDLDALRRQARPDPSRRQTAEQSVRKIQQDQQNLQRDWSKFQEQRYLRAPHDTSLQTAHTCTLEEVAAFLPADTALLEYVTFQTWSGNVINNEAALFVVTQKNGKPRLNVYRLKIAGDDLEQKAQALRDACAGRPNTTDERPYKDLARELYGLLIAPAEPALTGVRRLILCPDGPLWDVPFQALLSSPGTSGKPESSRTAFLWERYALTYAYSATEAKAALDTRQRPNRSTPQQTLLVMANPDFGQSAHSLSAAPRTASASRGADETLDLFTRGGVLSPLPYTQIEANAIRTAFPDAVLKTGVDAQESLLKQTGANYRYLHFATHAVFNDAVALLSGVVLAKPPHNSPEDGILTAQELLGMHLSADMIVFSACETARGVQKPGEGLIGLTWAAFVAGVPAQVVSQWSVDDEATAQLMGRFYQELQQGKSKDAALRSAALSLLHDGKHEHPFYWAPFLVMGDWR
jgi:CHAT domain-containing protein